MQYGTVAAGRVCAWEVHGIRTTSGGTLAYVTMVAQRIEHEVVIQIVLPEENLGLVGVGGKTDITSQTIAVNLNVAAINAFQRHLPYATVDELELRTLALVVDAGVVKDTVRVADGRTASGLVNDAECLAVWYILTAVGHRLVNGEVIELSIATGLAFDVKSKEGMT